MPNHAQLNAEKCFILIESFKCEKEPEIPHNTYKI